MPIEILMPALSPTMTEGTVSRWLKNEGDKVASGDVIAEIETDKATMEVEAVDEGTMGKIVVAAGTENVKVNDVIALLLGDGEDKAALSSAAKAPPKAAAAPEPAPEPAKPAAAPAPAKVAAPAPAPAANGHAPSSGRLFASPLARRLAKDGGIDLTTITGSGPYGRIVRADVEQAAKSPKPKQAPGAKAPTGPLDAFELVPHTGMRKVIARRLTEAASSIPHFYLTVDLQIDALMKLRSELNKVGEDEDFKLSVNDFVVKACALALRRMPEVNSAWSEDGMMRFNAVDVAVAVALPAGLITPIVRDADKKTLPQISNEVKALVDRAKSGKLKPEEFQGGSFSVSNLGMYGISNFTAIINPPQSCILAVGAGEQRAVVVDGAVVVKNMMSCTMSCDHRVVDGALGAQFLAKVRKLIENPLSMML
jgi:pyruvate dehydrogenase E2 component (dihydrolipoamide acetyltransferase)